jgi:hypothetical protein
MRFALAVVLVTACGHSDPKSPAQPESSPSDSTSTAVPDQAAADTGPIPCDVVAHSAVKMARQGSADKTPEATLTTFQHHCESDGWSPELRKCLVTARDFDEQTQCMRFMTDVQWKSLADELTAQGWNVAPRQ